MQESDPIINDQSAECVPLCSFLGTGRQAPRRKQAGRRGRQDQLQRPRPYGTWLPLAQDVPSRRQTPRSAALSSESLVSVYYAGTRSLCTLALCRSQAQRRTAGFFETQDARSAPSRSAARRRNGAPQTLRDARRAPGLPALCRSQAQRRTADSSRRETRALHPRALPPAGATAHRRPFEMRDARLASLRSPYHAGTRRWRRLSSGRDALAGLRGCFFSVGNQRRLRFAFSLSSRLRQGSAVVKASRSTRAVNSATFCKASFESTDARRALGFLVFCVQVHGGIADLTDATHRRLLRSVGQSPPFRFQPRLTAPREQSRCAIAFNGFPRKYVRPHTGCQVAIFSAKTYRIPVKRWHYVLR